MKDQTGQILGFAGHACELCRHSPSLPWQLQAAPKRVRQLCARPKTRGGRIWPAGRGLPAPDLKMARGVQGEAIRAWTPWTLDLPRGPALPFP